MISSLSLSPFSKVLYPRSLMTPPSALQCPVPAGKSLMGSLGST